VTNLARTIKALKAENIWVIGLDGSTETSLYQIDLSVRRRNPEPSEPIIIALGVLKSI
jgi:tRNA G18 (ribose-2'-O)-methylase SpoU